MSDELLNRCIDLIRSGEREEASRILARIVQEDPQNDAAWAWLSACFDEKERKLYCLDRAITINPQNLIALDGLAKITPELALAADERHLAQDTLFEDRPAAENAAGIDPDESSHEPEREFPFKDVREPEENAYTEVKQPIEALVAPQWSSAGRRPRRNRRPRPRVSPWLVALVIFLLVVLIAIIVFAIRIFLPMVSSTPGRFSERTAEFMREAELLMAYSDGSNNFGAFTIQQENVAKAYDRMQADWPANLAYQKAEMDMAMLGWNSVGEIADLMAGEGECQVEGELQGKVKNYTNSLAVDKTCEEWAAALLDVANSHYNQARPGLESYHEE